MEIRQAVILAGGTGKRLWPLTKDIPKAMVKVDERPFIEYIIEQLYEQGIGDIVILTGYKGEKIEKHLGDGIEFGVDITYSHGKISDLSGKRMTNALKFLDRKFLMLYCDTLWNLDLKDLTLHYKLNRGENMLTAYTNKDGSGEYGKENNVTWDDDDNVIRYGAWDKDSEYTGVNIGYYVISKKMVSKMPTKNVSFEKDIIPRLIKRRQLSVNPTDDRYYYLTYPDDINKYGKYIDEVQRIKN